MAIRYDPWSPASPTLNPLPGSAPAVDPSSLPLTEEPVAGFKPATKQGFRYESRNIAGGTNVISRAVPVSVPTGEPAKGEDTLYGRYATKVPTMVAEATAMAAGGDIEAAREVFKKIDTWIEADQPRLLKHMAYQGRDSMAADFAKQAGKAVRRDWLQNPQVQMLMNPKTNDAVAQHKLALGGFTPGSKLYDDTVAMGRGDVEAGARIQALRDATGFVATPVRSSRGTQGAAVGGRPAASAPLSEDPQFLEKVYDRAGTVAPSLFSSEALKTFTPRQTYSAVAQYTALEDMHPQAPRIITKAMDGARDAAPQDQIARFEHATRVVREVSDAAGDHAPDALTAFESLMGVREGASGSAFRSGAQAMQQTAVGVAGQVATARRLGFEVTDEAIKGFAAISAGSSSQIPDAYKPRAAAFESFLAPFLAVTTTMPVNTPPGVVAEVGGAGATPAGEGVAPATSGFSMITDRIKSLAMATAISSAGDPNVNAGSLQNKLLARHQDVGSALMMFGGDVPGADGKLHPMKRDEADAYGTLLLAYVAANPQVSIVDAYDTIRKDVGVRSVSDVAAETSAKAKAADDANAKAADDANAKAAADAKAVGATEKGPDAWAAVPDAVRLREARRGEIRKALAAGPAVARGAPSVDANMYEALAKGPSVAGESGLLPGYKPVSLVQKEVKKALIPVTQAVAAAAQEAFLDLTPGQLRGLRTGVTRSAGERRSFLLSDVSGSTYADLVRGRVALVKQGLSTRGAEQSLALIGDDVLNAAALALAKPLARVVGDSYLTQLEKTAEMSTRTMRELLSPRDIQRVRDAAMPFDALPNYLSAGIIHTALSEGGEEPASRATMVGKLFLQTGFALDTQAVVESAPGVARNLGRAGIVFGDFADTYFGRAVQAGDAPGRATNTTTSAEPNTPGTPPMAPVAPAKELPAYVLSAKAAYAAAHPGSELDPGPALEAGKAVSDRIKSRPLTEAARAALYGPAIRQSFAQRGIGLEELDYQADSLAAAYFAGKIPLDQIPGEYTKRLGGALKNRQKKAATDEDAADLAKRTRDLEWWVKKEKIRAGIGGAGGLGVVTPEGEPGAADEQAQ